MRPLTSSTLLVPILLFPTLNLASSHQLDESTQAEPNTSPSLQTIPQATPTHSSTHYNDLELRQGVGAAGGTVAPLPSATQMSPITSYLLMGPNGVRTPVPHTQTFAQVPEQWPGPFSGAIGLGSIQGVVGVVKTADKRDVEVAEPTLVTRPQRIVKRKKKPTSGGSSDGAAGAVRVPVLTLLGVGLGVGLGVVGLL